MDAGAAVQVTKKCRKATTKGKPPEAHFFEGVDVL
jgi:hypothetical protein